MAEDLASIVVQLFGAAICVVSVLGMIMPAVLLGMIRKIAARPSGFLGAVAARIVLGGALLTAASVSRFPGAFIALGWVAIVAALVLLFVGHPRFQKLAGWVARWPVNAVRVGLALGAVFGLFLVYAVTPP